MRYIVKLTSGNDDIEETRRLLTELKSVRRELRAERRKIRRPAA